MKNEKSKNKIVVRDDADCALWCPHCIHFGETCYFDEDGCHEFEPARCHAVYGCVGCCFGPDV